MQLIQKIKTGGIAAISVAVITVFVAIAAWLTHIIACLQNNEWGFLIAGALFFPIAMIHGFGVWIGVW